MDIFNKSLEIWKGFDDKSKNIFETKIIFNEEYIGKNNNCLSAMVRAIILLDGKLNQLHFVKHNDLDISHCSVLMTPQPINQYSQIELSPTKQFIALIGYDTVGIIDISNISIPKTCKKVKEVFKTSDEILSVKWYPDMNDFIVILTKQSINIFQCCSNMRIVPCYQYYLQNDICAHPNSFGIKDEFVTFDFGSSESGIDDNKLLILTDSGDVLLLSELRILIKNVNMLPKKLLFLPQSEDNYQDDFTSFAVLRGSIDLLILVNSNGTSQHALLINGKIYVYETIKVLAIINDTSYGPIIIADRHAYPPRYLLLHSTGIRSCVLPWVVHLRLVVQGKCETNIATIFNEAGSAVIDHVINTDSLHHINTIPTKILGVTIIREAMNSPELYIYLHANEKHLIKAKLRQESTLMTVDNDNDIKELDISGHMWPHTPDSSDTFINAILSKLRSEKHIPCFAATVSDNDDECDLKLTLVLKVSELLTGDFGTRMEAAGEIFDQRLGQMESIVKLQHDQVSDIMTNTKKLQEKKDELKERFDKVLSRQNNLLKRLNVCSNKFAVLNNSIPRADRESVTKIRNVEKKLSSMQTLLRSCKLRFEQNESSIDNLAKKKKEIKDVSIDIDKDKALIFLMKEDEEIKNLVEDIRGLMN